MAIVRTGESEYDKELQKWDTPKRMGGFGPDGHEPFPRMVYKAFRRDNGKVMCMDMDALYAQDMNTVAKADAFNRSCTLVVKSEGEWERAKSQGWCDSPADALEAHEKHAQAIAQAAAEVNYSVQRMSEKAQREHRAADEATEDPVTDVAAPARGPRGKRVAVA